MLNKMKTVERSKNSVDQERIEKIMITEDNVVIKTFSDIVFDERIDENCQGILLSTTENG